MSTTQQREPGDGEFEAIVASHLADLDALNTDTAHTAPATSDPQHGAEPAVREPELPEPELPDLPEVRRRPEYGRPGLVLNIGFGMTVAMAAIGQTLFLREWFGGGLAATVAACFLAACLEVTMIGTGDAALAHRANGERGWPLLLAISGGVCGLAVTLQVLHWLPSAGIAVMFGGASAVGWVAHIATGWIKGSGYLDDKSARDEALAARNRKLQQHADAVYERRFAAWETQQQAAQRAIATVEPSEPAKPAKPAKAESAGTSKARSGQAPRPDRQQVIAWARDNAAGYKRTAAHFQKQGYRLPESTARDWLNTDK